MSSKPLSIEQNMLKFGPFTYDPKACTLMHRGRSVALTPKATAVLAVLLEAGGNTVSKDALLEMVWPGSDVQESSLTQNVHVLRTALRTGGLDGAIQTMPGEGYRMAVPVVPVAAGASKRWRAIAIAAAFCAIAALPFSPYRAGNATASPLNAEASRLYRLGRYYWNLRTTNGFAESLKYFYAARRLAPRNALVASGIADAYTEIADYECIDIKPCPQIERQARAYAETALRLDRNLSEAHASQAQVLRVFEGNYRISDLEFQHALVLDPQNAIARAWYGFSLLRRGKLSAARVQLEAAAALDPVATATNAALAENAYFEHRYHNAVRYARDTLRMEPARAETWIVLALAQERIGDLRAARESLAAARRYGWSPTDVAAMDGAIDAAQGNRAGAAAALHRLKDRCGEDVAVLLAALGNTQGAKASLNCARTSGDPFAFERRYDWRLAGRPWARAANPNRRFDR
jgi:DNA-binding winged helix-turn-helix (wHTH) protein/Tfp pilus assembly protein PilF